MRLSWARSSKKYAPKDSHESLSSGVRPVHCIATVSLNASKLNMLAKPSVFHPQVFV